MAFIRILATVVAVFVIQSSATPLSRSKRDTQCRIEGLLVGGTVVGEEGGPLVVTEVGGEPEPSYIFDVPTEADCIAKCNKIATCTSVNYFAQWEACLPYEESLNDNRDNLQTVELSGETVYIKVKNCGGQRQKRQTEGCRKEGLLVGGTVVNSEYIFDVASEADCVAKCNEMEKCTAVNYFPDYKACLPQEESLATHQRSLHAAQNPLTAYVIVKGCTGNVPEPEFEPEYPTAELVPDRRKRQTEGCRKEGLVVGATYIGEGYLLGVTTEEECIEKCNAKPECNAVNYFQIHEACLLHRESLVTDVESLETGKDDSAVYVVVKGCTGSLPDPRPQPVAETRHHHLHLPWGRRKRQTEGCRKEGLLVGATYIGEGYINGVSEQECIEKCNAEQECNAINYIAYSNVKLCLLQRETLITDVDSIHTRQDKSAVYVIVKGCTGSIPLPNPDLIEPELPEPTEEEETNQEPEPEAPTESEQSTAETRSIASIAAAVAAGKHRPKRQTKGCRKEGLMVGGTVIKNEYIFEMATEADCVAKCNELETCVAVNYFPEHQACLPQEESLATHKDSLHTGQNPYTVYVIVKGCDGTVPEPNPEPEYPTAELVSERRKRQTSCKTEKLFVGGQIVGGYILNVKTEQDCITECNKLEQCTAVNYFPLHEACLPQEENLKTTPDLPSREEDIADYIIVKGCGGSQPEEPIPFPPLPRPEEQ
jgi:phenylpyruvate tautomerase PptA (4-oxalocrotonate tautomerase family)